MYSSIIGPMLNVIATSESAQMAHVGSPRKMAIDAQELERLRMAPPGGLSIQRPRTRGRRRLPRPQVERDAQERPGASHELWMATASTRLTTTVAGTIPMTNSAVLITAQGPPGRPPDE